MADKLQEILRLVDEYVTDKEKNKTWTAGEDWVGCGWLSDLTVGK